LPHEHALDGYRYRGCRRARLPPTRFYDTSFIEWSHLAYGSTPKQRVLRESSPFRTDLPSLTEHATVTGYTPGGAYDAATMPVAGGVDGPNCNDDADYQPDSAARGTDRHHHGEVVIDLAFTVRPLPFDSLCDDEVRSHP